MAIGYQITQNGINARAGSLAVRLKELADESLAFDGAINALSLTGVGFTSGDATAMTTVMAQMAAVANIYYGTITISPAFSFDATLAALRGLGAPG